MKIAVVGMGKIGLPLAAQYASKGHTVVGIDVNPDTVAKINSAKEPFPGEFGLAEALKTHVLAGRLRATISYQEAIPTADVVVVVVPLFVNQDDRPDFGWMDSATTSIGQSLTNKTLVIYETTLPIGTTRSRWKPLLEELSGLQEGFDFHLVFSPERVLTGRVFEDLRKYPKLIGGLSEAGADLARTFYTTVLDFDERDDLDKPNGIWNLGSAEAAEMAKLAETTYRDVNIALANQFALHAEEIGVDVYKVIEACNSQPYSHIHRPGISVGGHCIPVYPRLYLSTDKRGGVVAEARKINSAMPRFSLGSLVRRVGSLKARNVAILGASYRAGVKETAYSGAFDLFDRLLQEDAIPTVIDPLYSHAELHALGLTPCANPENQEILILNTEHPSFLSLTESDFPKVSTFFDGRAVIDHSKWPSVDFVVLGNPPAPSR